MVDNRLILTVGICVCRKRQAVVACFILRYRCRRVCSSGNIRQIGIGKFFRFSLLCWRIFRVQRLIGIFFVNSYAVGIIYFTVCCKGINIIFVKRQLVRFNIYTF